MPIFIETTVFRRACAKHLDAEAFRALQNAILEETTRIDTIPGTGGLKKARWGTASSGKRGGLRVIFYHMAQRQIYLLLLLYPKGKKDDLTPEQKKILQRLVQDEFNQGA